MYEEDDDLYGVQARMNNRVRRRDKARKKRKKDQAGTAPTAHRDAPTTAAVVIEVGPGSATVVTPDDEVLSCVLDAALRRRQRTALAVGDDVVVARDPSGVDLVIRVGHRSTSLSRSDPAHQFRERVVVANVDVVVVVGSATDPPLRPRLVDRYLVAIQRGGARPAIVINKIDLADPERRAELQAIVAPWEAIDVPVLWVSASTGEGVEALLGLLQGKRCAFVGHSGVGKSSLVSSLGSTATAGSLAEHGRGRHTTSSSALHRLPGGAEVIDTPGVRQFGLYRLTPRELREGFAELDALSPGCAFSDCTHDHEDGCAVRQAVEAGTIPAARYDSYLRLLTQLMT